MKSRITKEKHEILDKVLGKSDHDFDQEKEGYFYITCVCGKSEHQEYILNDKPTIICSNCGEIYYNLGSVMEYKKTK